MTDMKIGIIGCGNMSGAILEGALKSGAISPEDVYVYDRSEAMMERASGWGVSLALSPEDVCCKADLVLLGVKPQQAEVVLRACGSSLAGKALMSIVTGTPVDRLRSWINGEARILRLMPNTPAMVSEGAFAVCEDNDFTAEEFELAERIFTSIGIMEMLPEKLIDAAAAVSGGGPAFFAMFIEAMADGGVKQGLPRQTAYRLAAQTAIGTSKMILEGMHPGQLKDMVTSPGGTTIEGCETLERGGMRGAVIDCINKAAEKNKRI